MKLLHILVCLFLMVFTTTKQDADNIVIDDNVMKVGQKVDEASVTPSTKKKFNVSEHRLIYTKTPDGRPYAVYDNIIPSKYQVLVKNYLTFDNEGWLFNNYDSDDVNKQRTHDNTPWINDRDPVAFSKTKLCKRLLRAVIDVSKDEGPYYPYRVFGKIIRRGDHTRVSADSTDEGEFSVMMFVNEFWKKNYYGELYLYDKKREIIGGATHKGGRVVVWESTIFRLNRPPAVSFLQGQVIFQVQFSKDKSKMEASYTKLLQYRKDREYSYKNWYLPQYKLSEDEPFTAPDPAKHKVLEYTTKTDGRKIVVFDGLFSKDLLDHLRGFVLKYGTYFYDDSIDSSSDNVQWIAGFLLNPYIQSPYWKIIRKLASYVTGNPNMFPYDVSINLIRSSDHTRIHGDVGYYGEEEFTVLVYLNPEWTKNNYGETTFFEKNSDDTEIVAQVRPRYGRTVIFDGNIPHSARPPSFNYSGARLTFVTKLHKNEYTGRKKNFQEEMRHYMAAVHGLSYLDELKGRRGEIIARKQLDEKKKMMEASTYHPETEVGDDSDGVEEKENEEEEDEDEKEPLREPLKMTKEELKQIQREQENLPFVEDREGLDEESLEFVTPLDDVTESTEDAVEKIITAHSKMRTRYSKLMQEYDEKITALM
ncbi:uncharacterized protein LOC130641105 [Hydractinia symbiolongicarpus]|uniref:uncharacterized protein LOC130641105 n=1 Tax=Hydractinia symbiolongicarpus TaxID=13093 RepID=UPI00254F48E0|nr:uncharacterized protein LOC130641105 [Hydractinia symbiolongicarpus]